MLQVKFEQKNYRHIQDSVFYLTMKSIFWRFDFGAWGQI